MAFASTWKNDAKIKLGTDGLVGVHESTPNYRAWARWLALEFGKRVFPTWLTVIGEWPPTTQEGADGYAVFLSDIRDSRYQKESSPIGGSAVPRHPAPWDGRVPPEIAA